MTTDTTSVNENNMSIEEYNLHRQRERKSYILFGRFRIGKLFIHHGKWHARITDIRKQHAKYITKSSEPCQGVRKSSGTDQEDLAHTIFHEYCKSIIEKEQYVKNILFNDAAEKFLSYCKENLSKQIYCSCKTAMNRYWIPCFSNNKVSHISELDEQKAIVAIRTSYDGHSIITAGTKKQIVYALKRFFEYCIKCEYIGYNPMHRWDKILKSCTESSDIIIGDETKGQ